MHRSYVVPCARLCCAIRGNYLFGEMVINDATGHHDLDESVARSQRMRERSSDAVAYDRSFAMLASGSTWERLEASGSIWEHLGVIWGSRGCIWESSGGESRKSLIFIVKTVIFTKTLKKPYVF